MIAASREEYRASEAVEMVRRGASQGDYVPTHRRVINTLESLKQFAAASWYWQHHGIQGDEDLDQALNLPVIR